MYRCFLLATGTSTAKPLGFQGTPMNVVNASRSRCLLFVRRLKRPSKLDPSSRPHDHLVTLVSTSLESSHGPTRLQSRHFTPHNLEVHCFADLCQPALTLFSSQPSPRTATVVTFDVPAEHMRRLSNELWQDAAFAVNLVPELFLHHRHRFW